MKISGPVESVAFGFDKSARDSSEKPPDKGRDKLREQDLSVAGLVTDSPLPPRQAAKYLNLLKRLFSFLI